MNETERYLFDTQGCIVVEDVLGPVQVERLLEGIPRHRDGRIVREAETREGGGKIDFAHEEMLGWDEPLFRDLIDHPQILPYLETIMGEQVEDPWAKPFYLAQVNGLTFEKGDTGPSFHHGGTPYQPVVNYTARHGKIYSGLTNVTWCLTDADAGDGGLWYIPGSHKAHFALPAEIRDYRVVPPCVFQPAVKAGSAIIFTEALTHGTKRWAAEHARVTLYYRYVPGYLAHLVKDRPPEALERMSQRQKELCVPEKL